jgi:hypothetical protein
MTHQAECLSCCLIPRVTRHGPVAQVLELYTQRLQQRGVATQQEVAAWQREAGERFEAELAASRAGDYNVSAAQWVGSTWQGDALHVSAPSGSRVTNCIFRF